MRLIFLIVPFILGSSCNSKKQAIQDRLVCTIIEEHIPRRVPFLPLPEEQTDNLGDKKLLLCSVMSFDFFDDLHIKNHLVYLRDSLGHKKGTVFTGTFTGKLNCSSQINIELLNKEQVPQSHLDHLFQEHGADGLLLLSPISISEDGNIASFLIAYGCGTLCGSVERVTLSKVNSEWVIRDHKTIAIS